MLESKSLSRHHIQLVIFHFGSRGELLMALASKKVLLAGLTATLALGLAQVSNAQGTAPEQPALRTAIPGAASTQAITPERIKKDYWLAFRLVKYPWLDKVVEADPRIVAAICQHADTAKLLAKHRHLDKIAESDHFLCRRLTQWEGATQQLLRSPYADKVIALDPQGMVFALNRKPEYARIMIRHPMFDNLVDLDRDFPREIQKHIR
jgi:hypothetical protein